MRENSKRGIFMIMILIILSITPSLAVLTGGLNCIEENHTFVKDTILPALNINSPSSDQYQNYSLLSISLVVNDSNLNYTNISIVNSTGSVINSTINTTNSTFYLNLSIYADGIYNVTAISYDLAQNTNRSTVTGVRIATNDSISPTVNFSCTPKVLIQDGVTNCTCSAIDDLSPTSNITLNYTSNPNTHTIGGQVEVCYATDLANNIGNATYILNIVAKTQGGGGSQENTTIISPMTCGDGNCTGNETYLTCSIDCFSSEGNITQKEDIEPITSAPWQFEPWVGYLLVGVLSIVVIKKIFQADTPTEKSIVEDNF